MAEKEIKPADPKPDAPKADDHPHTQERPGTGTTPQPEKPTTNKGGGDGGSGGKSWTGSVDYGDGYTMGRDEKGDTYLQHPDGSRATWDGDGWRGEGNEAKSSDWAGGHRPTDFGPRH